MLGHLLGISYRDTHPRELNASSRGVSKKLDRVTWHSEWIARWEKFSNKSSHAFSSWNRTKSWGKGAEEKEEEPQRLIGFLEGTNFLGAMRRKLNKRERENKEHSENTRYWKEEQKQHAMHDNARTCYMLKIFHHRYNPIQTTTLTLYNQAHNLECMKIWL